MKVRITQRNGRPLQRFTIPDLPEPPDAIQYNNQTYIYSHREDKTYVYSHVNVFKIAGDTYNDNDHG